MSADAARKEEEKEMTKVQAERIEKAIREFRDGTKVLQIESHYKEGNRYHHCHQGKVMDTLGEGHPNFTTLDLDWSWSGDCIRIPKSIAAVVREVEDVHNYNVARREKYVDKEGNVKEAISYGTKYTELIIWYDFEEVKCFFKS